MVKINLAISLGKNIIKSKILSVGIVFIYKGGEIPLYYLFREARQREVNKHFFRKNAFVFGKILREELKKKNLDICLLEKIPIHIFNGYTFSQTGVFINWKVCRDGVMRSSAVDMDSLDQFLIGFRQGLKN